MSLSHHRKQLTLFVAKDQIQAHKEKLEFWEICIYFGELLTASQYLKDSDEKRGLDNALR